jgi:hypothetical protein
MLTLGLNRASETKALALPLLKWARSFLAPQATAAHRHGFCPRGAASPTTAS